MTYICPSCGSAYTSSCGASRCCAKMPLFTLGYKELHSMKLIGDGAFGVVREYVPPGSEERPVALKQFIKNLDELDQEMKIMMSVEHENLVKSYGYFSIDTIKSGIVMELCQGNLKDVMEKRKREIHEVLHTLAQIANGLNYLHNNNILHRDLKPTNILVKSRESIEDGALTEMQFKIGDFGLSRYVDVMLTQTMSTVGSLNYIAPEILERAKAKLDGSGNHEARYSYKADIYSYGQIGFDLMHCLENGGISKDNIKILLDKCGAEEPVKRPDSTEIMQCLGDLRIIYEIRDKREQDEAWNWYKMKQFGR